MKPLHDMGNVSIGRQPGHHVPGVPGFGMRTWMLPILVALVLSLFYALYLLDQQSLNDGTIIDAQTLQLVHQIRQIDRVKPATLTETASLRQAIDISITLLVISERAGTVTAAVGLFDSRVNRIFASGDAASSVLRYAQVSEELMPGSDMADSLRDLAVALSTYDIDRVRSSSLRLAELRQQLSSAINATQQLVNTPAAANLKLD